MLQYFWHLSFGTKQDPTVLHIRTYSTSVQALCVELVTVVSTAGMRCNAWRAGNKVCRQLLVASS